MITSEIVKKGIDYIIQHLDEKLTIEDVANHCHFSKYHFSRLFKAETGESLYAFIKRLRMEQSAIRIKLEKDKCITDIGVDYGYSSSNYSSAFKKHHNVSPAEFRQGTNATCAPHPFFKDNLVRFKSFEEYDKQILIKELDDFLVIYERHLGNYIELGNNWDEFTQKYRDYYKEDTLLIEKFYDDPSITSVDQCLYDICMTVDNNCSLHNVTTIKGGKFAVYRFDGLVQDIFAAFQGVFNIWLPDSGYEMDERYGLDIYRSIDKKNMHVVMDLCIPIK
jgi:AraC family transcriptional regulator